MSGNRAVEMVPYRFHVMVDAFFVYSILHGQPLMRSCDVSDAEVLSHSELGHAPGRLLRSAGKLYKRAEVGLGLEAGGGTDRHAGAFTLDAQVRVPQSRCCAAIILVFTGGQRPPLWGTERPGNQARHRYSIDVK